MFKFTSIFFYILFLIFGIMGIFKLMISSLLTSFLLGLIYIIWEKKFFIVIQNQKRS